MSRLLDYLGTKVSFTEKLKISIPKDIINSEELKIIGKFIGGRKNNEIIKKAFDAYAFNNLKGYSNIYNQVEYSNIKTEFFYKLRNRKHNLTYEKHEYISIQIELWKLIICINEIPTSYLTEEDLYNHVIKWNVNMLDNIFHGGFHEQTY